jgi:hypothetical protein
VKEEEVEIDDRVVDNSFEAKVSVLNKRKRKREEKMRNFCWKIVGRQTICAAAKILIISLSIPPFKDTYYYSLSIYARIFSCCQTAIF